MTDKEKSYSGILNNDSPRILEFSQSVSSDGKEILTGAFSLLLERKEELTTLFGGKSYNTMLLIELSSELGFKVPHTEYITTNFYKSLISIPEQNNLPNDLVELDGLLDEFNKFSNDNEYISDENTKILRGYFLIGELKIGTNKKICRL